MGTRVQQDSSAIRMPRPIPSKIRARQGQRSMMALLPSLANIVLTIAFILSLIINGAFFPLTRRGFFCSDLSIRYPLKPDTVSFKVLMLVSLIIPSIVISLLDRKLTGLIAAAGERAAKTRKNSEQQDDCEEAIELMQLNKSKRKIQTSSEAGSTLAVDGPEKEDCDNQASQSDIEASLKGDRASVVDDDDSTVRFVRTSGDRAQAQVKKHSDFQLFMFGMVVTFFLTGVGKMTAGRLRPHFMDRCKPNIDCSLPAHSSEYIVDFECTEESITPHIRTYITTSFPSGHSSCIFFSMLYLIFYLNLTIPTIASYTSPRRSVSVGCYPLLIFAIYTLMVGAAIHISMTRISDYHHHPTDVLSGAILGSAIAVIISRYMLAPRFNLYKQPA